MDDDQGIFLLLLNLILSFLSLLKKLSLFPKPEKAKTFLFFNFFNLILFSA